MKTIFHHLTLTPEQELTSLYKIKEFIKKEGFSGDSHLIRAVNDEIDYVKRGSPL